MLRHMRYYHAGEKPFSCEECLMSFNSKYSLNQHKQSKHPIKGVTISFKYECYLCKFKSRNLYTMTVHMQCHTGEKIFGCDKCPDRFSTKMSLRTHKKTHNSNYKKIEYFFCDRCPLKFRIQSNLNKHKVVHEGKFKCSKCSKRFAEQSGLSNHRKVHAKNWRGTRTHECYICRYKHLNVFMVRNHMRRHV